MITDQDPLRGLLFYFLSNTTRRARGTREPSICPWVTSRAVLTDCVASGARGSADDAAARGQQRRLAQEPHWQVLSSSLLLSSLELRGTTIYEP